MTPMKLFKSFLRFLSDVALIADDIRCTRVLEVLDRDLALAGELMLYNFDSFYTTRGFVRDHGWESLEEVRSALGDRNRLDEILKRVHPECYESEMERRAFCGEDVSRK